MERFKQWPNKMKLIIGLVTVPILLASCTMDPGVWNGRNQFQNEVAVREQHVQIHFAPNSTYLTRQQKELLQQDLAPIRNVKKIFLSACYPVSSTLNQARVHALQQQVTKMGYDATIIAPASNLNKHYNDCVNVTLQRLVVIPPNCPNLVSPGSNYYKISSNFGCSTVRNLGVEIAYPEDLINPGRGTGPTGSARQALAQQAFDEGFQTSLIPSTESKTLTIGESS